MGEEDQHEGMYETSRKQGVNLKDEMGLRGDVHRRGQGQKGELKLAGKDVQSTS